MNDRSVRKCFHESVLQDAHQDTDTIVLNEFGLKNGSVRADIAILNGKMVGYEIKTDKDNLKRLPHQIEAYNEVFDENYIVIGSRYIKKVETILPDWWGIYLIEQSHNGKFNFRKVKMAKKNKLKNCIGVAQLLWKDELFAILNSAPNCIVKKSITKEDLNFIAQTNFKVSTLSKIALKYLKSREGWRTNRKELL